MARKTFYSGFSTRLQELLRYTTDHRESMEALGEFTAADRTQVTTLLNALNAAREYFPGYQNAP